MVLNTSITSSSYPTTASAYQARNPHTVGNALAQVNQDMTLQYIQAWEDKERANANNRFEKALAKVSAWESAKKAGVESRMRQALEDLERKRAAILERMKNEHAEIHRIAQEKIARASGKRQAEFVRINEEAEEYRSRGYRPSTCFPCF